MTLPQRLASLIAHADRHHSDAEQRAAARALGVEDHLPHPQDVLPLAGGGGAE